MSITKTEAELLSHKTAALTKLEKYLDTLKMLFPKKK